MTPPPIATPPPAVQQEREVVATLVTPAKQRPHGAPSARRIKRLEEFTRKNPMWKND